MGINRSRIYYIPMQEWTMIIKPHQKLWSVDFKEIWRYRDLIELFVKRNIVVQYKQTILGPLWYLIQPVITVIMNMVVFGGIAKMSTDGVPQAIFYMAGNICWFYFADCLNQTSSTFTAVPYCFLINPMGTFPGRKPGTCAFLR